MESELTRIFKTAKARIADGADPELVLWGVAVSAYLFGAMGLLAPGAGASVSDEEARRIVADLAAKLEAAVSSHAGG